jgi:HemY protein
MFRIILFLIVIALGAFGAAWVADQSGDVALTWGGWRIESSLPIFVLILTVVFIVAIAAWSLVRAVWRMPERIRRRHHDRRHVRGRHAITHGLIAIGTGDPIAARRHAQIARRDAHQDPLALLLHAQASQLNGDRHGAQSAFRSMAEREDTRLLGLRGLFIEAQRADDAVAAVAVAQEALKIAPASPWATHAVLGFRCAKGDWNGALAILDGRSAAGQIDKNVYRRERGVLLTARALDLETQDRDASRASVMEAVKLAPTLVPAAVLAAKFLSEAHQIRRAMRIIETAWLAQPHPDLADAYAHVRLGDSARQRLVRVEILAAKMPGHVEGALALARAAIDAGEFARARQVLTSFVAAPTQRVAMLMAEIERTEYGDSGRARGWMLRAVRAAHDPVWTADGYVSDRWRPVSPVSGRLDAFQWLTPLAALTSDKSADVEVKPLPESDITAQDPSRYDRLPEARIAAPSSPGEAERPSGETVTVSINEKVPAIAPVAPAPPETIKTPAASPPVFRSRGDLGQASAAPPPIIPIIRAPDDPGVDELFTDDEFADSLAPSSAQRGGWQGFWSRWSR